MRNYISIFLVFLRLGLTSFGGPIAHLGFFHREFVQRKKWISDRAFTDLVALCQLLPGPASSQVGISLGLLHGGYFGALLAWIGFTMPSAIIMTLSGMSISKSSSWLNLGIIHGLKIAAVAVVAQALWVMASSLCADRKRASIALISAIISVTFSTFLGQVLAILFGGVCGWLLLREKLNLPSEPLGLKVRKTTSVIILVIFLLLLIFLPLLVFIFPKHALEIFARFFRVGSLVFGGGHVVLPLLQAEVVNTGWVSQSDFMTGYGLAQAIPGPLFTFSAYLGASSTIEPAGWIGALIALVGIFLPSFLLIFGIMPFWEKLREMHHIRNILLGINAAVVGLLLSAFYNPVWTSAILHVSDFLMASSAFLLLSLWRMPSWTIVAFCAASAWLLHMTKIC